jgi:hypothetical protein
VTAVILTFSHTLRTVEIGCYRYSFSMLSMEGGGFAHKEFGVNSEQWARTENKNANYGSLYSIG